MQITSGLRYTGSQTIYYMPMSQTIEIAIGPDKEHLSMHNLGNSQTYSVDDIISEIYWLFLCIPE